MAREQAQRTESSLAGTFNFRVRMWLSGAGVPAAVVAAAGASPVRDMLLDAGFQECSGLEIEMDVQEHQEGGRNDGVVRLLGRGKYASLVLKRGMLFPANGRVNGELWRWLQSLLSGTPVPVRYDGLIEVLERPEGRGVMAWSFTRALPQKIRGPELNARTGEIALEELHLAHEGLRMEIGI